MAFPYRCSINTTVMTMCSTYCYVLSEPQREHLGREGGGKNRLLKTHPSREKLVRVVGPYGNSYSTLRMQPKNSKSNHSVFLVGWIPLPAWLSSLGLYSFSAWAFHWQNVCIVSPVAPLVGLGYPVQGVGSDWQTGWRGRGNSKPSECCYWCWSDIYYCRLGAAAWHLC